MSDDLKAPEPEPKPTVQKLKALCHTYAIQREEDAVYMNEHTIGDGRLDVLTVDLGKLLIRGFEVKVDRGDFLKDDKWHEYMRYLNFFYFVAPPGVIKPEELPPEVFLLEYRITQVPVSRWEREGKTKPHEELVVVKRGKRLQPRFVRETYGEHFFHKILLSYVRNLRWRTKRIGGALCAGCGNELSEDPVAAERGA